MKEYQIGFSDEFSCLEECIKNRIFKETSIYLSELFDIAINNIDDKDKIELELLRWSINNEGEYYRNIVLIPFCYWLFNCYILDNLIQTRDWFKDGMKYGIDFEKYIKNTIKNNFPTFNPNCKADAGVILNNKEYLLEIKISKTNTDSQLERYIKESKIKDAITINGTHKNNIEIKLSVDVYYLVEKLIVIFMKYFDNANFEEFKYNIDKERCNYMKGEKDV